MRAEVAAETNRRGVSISWFGDHRRSREIAHVTEVDAHFVKDSARFLPVRYVRQHFQTTRILREASPHVIVVMQPPPIALASVLAYAKKNRALVIGDLHSGTFLDPKWRWAARWVLKMLRRYGGAIVPNGDLAAACRLAGVEVFVSHGWITPLPDLGQKLPDGIDASRPFVLVPFTYAKDEPVQAVLAAARRTPDVQWVLTGRPPAAVRQDASANVAFPGFVPKPAFDALRLHARAILALTTQQSTMQSAGYEAVASSTPLITVRQQVIADYFGSHAMYTALSADALASAVDEVIRDNDHWRAEMLALQQLVIASQEEATSHVRDWIMERTALAKPGSD